MINISYRSKFSGRSIELYTTKSEQLKRKKLVKMIFTSVFIDPTYTSSNLSIRKIKRTTHPNSTTPNLFETLNEPKKTQTNTRKAEKNGKKKNTSTSGIG